MNSDLNGRTRIAVDLDGVEAEFAEPFLKFRNEKYGTNYTKADIFTYDFWSVFRVSREQSIKDVLDFYNSPEFEKIVPIPGSQEATSLLSKKYFIAALTARPDFTMDKTLSWLEKYFPNVFSEFHFTNHFAGNGKSKNKSDFCLEYGYEILIDDYHGHANECARRGIDVFLMEQPWNWETLHPKVIRVRNWREIQERLR
ncbi:hypothetical protein HY449_00045 [Candidatus Pacearchaeota archaeon]|nr:hypothetical protein [Candidatus Pacearchaeota archaeon]